MAPASHHHTGGGTVSVLAPSESSVVAVVSGSEWNVPMRPCPFLLIAALGPGKFALDALRRRR